LQLSISDTVGIPGVPYMGYAYHWWCVNSCYQNQSLNKHTLMTLKIQRKIGKASILYKNDTESDKSLNLCPISLWKGSMAEWVWVVLEKMIWVFGGTQTFLCSFTGIRWWELTYCKKLGFVNEYIKFRIFFWKYLCIIRRKYNPCK
jgi:hypothetical protein